MLAITARLIHGTLRAGQMGDSAITGNASRGEWPPSPARIFGAFVAADGTRTRCHVTDGHELIFLEELGPPKVYADGPERVEWTSLISRFVPQDSTDKAMSQNYPARKASEVRPGHRASPQSPRITYVWDIDVPEETLRSLRLRARRIGYLGCADSPVQVTVTSEWDDEGHDGWVLGAPVRESLPVPYAGFTAALDREYDRLAEPKQVPRRAWVPTETARYAYGQSLVENVPEPRVIWLEFDRSLPGIRARGVAEALRSAVLERVDRKMPTTAGAPGKRAPWVLHGHDVPRGMGSYELARFLPLLHVGSRHGDGSIQGAAIWLPPITEAVIAEAVRAAVSDLKILRAPGINVRISPRSDLSRKWSTAPQRWIGPSRRWYSVTPTVAERGRRGSPTVDDVRRWFHNAGHPEPEWVNVAPVPTGRGVPKLRPNEVHRPGKDRYPFVWLEVGFDEPVSGPLCVGRMRSLGMGLLAPSGGER